MDNSNHENRRTRERRKTTERRASARIKRRDIIQYRIENLPFGRATEGVSQIRNLSEKGIFFTINFPLILEASLKIKLKFPILEESVELEGRIVACEQIGKGLYGLRVEFINLSGEQKELLKKFLQLFLSINKDKKNAS